MTQEQIHNVFRQGYNQSNWKLFLGDVFTKARLLSKPEQLTGIDSNLAEGALKLGNIELDENGIERQIAIFEVTLSKGVILERNRVGLRNLLRKHWKDIDASFIVYYHPNSNKWRFTYVSELTGYNSDGDLIKIKTEPKRYTYVLGNGESTRTASERFSQIAKIGNKLSLEDVKDAFSVEKLSKAFFDEYKKHYDIFCEYMVKKPNIRQTIFDGNEKAIRDFTKKLLGRIVFLYFIQKKGWLGVPVSSKWGQGNFNFLTDLFEKCKYPDLFYTEILTKLFFDTLNTKRKNDTIELEKEQPCRIPFLNGGLFEEDDKKQRSLIFESQLFKNLFAFFNQYNFTIYEDDPNDHTVAVDPEMLGHIFENLLEDNKDKGAFYTPKEIVHYMCQESLIEYLASWFKNRGYNVTSNTIIKNPAQPEIFSINEGRKGQIFSETTKNHIEYTLIEKFIKKKISEDDHKLLLSYLIQFNEALDNVKICDVAIGSGAFPMGLLHEIFTAKQSLFHFEHGNLVGFPASAIKLNIIQNSIYGVDIEKGAVDIARLRFWLSLVVDEDEPKALPNLDYKIVVGNSLVSTLGNDIIEVDWNIDETAHGLFGAILESKKKLLLAEIGNKQKEYFAPESNKKSLSTDIRSLKIDLLINQLELMVTTNGLESLPTGTGKKMAKQTAIYSQTMAWKSKIKQLMRLKLNSDLPLSYFDWKLDFPEVMNEQLSNKKGFDIVIANPPYIDSETMVNTGQEVLREYLSKKLTFCKGNWDIYIAFFDVSFNLLNNTGNLAFITPDKWISKPFGDELRIGLLNNINSIAEAGRKVFENAKVDSIITSITKKEKTEIRIDKFINGVGINFSHVSKSTLHSPFAFDWLFSDFVKLINRIDKMPNKMSDFAICENACATADAYKLKDFILNSSFNARNHLKIINTGTIGRYISKWGVREMTYLKDKYLEPVVIKNEFLEAFPNSYGAKSTLPKVIIKGLTLLDGCIDLKGEIIPGKSTLVITKPKGQENELYFPLLLINTKLALFYIKEKYRGSSYNQGINFNPDMINALPIPEIPKKTMTKLINYATRLIDYCEQEKEIVLIENDVNTIIYRLYNLTFKEVKNVDPEFQLSKSEYEAISIQ